MNSNSARRWTKISILLFVIFAAAVGGAQARDGVPMQVRVAYDDRAAKTSAERFICQKIAGLVTPTNPTFACTKYCKDCQTCETYCCEGTTPEDLEVVIVDDD